MVAPRLCCLDLDTFFVSVERLLDPSLVGRPVIVGGGPGVRGVVTAASYEVRAYGIRAGMPSVEATRLAPPDTVWVRTRHGDYGDYAKRVRAVLERFCPEVQTASIDEFFLDFSGCENLYRRPGDADADATIERVVREMREAIQVEVGLPASAGIATTRPIAKIGSGRAKPAGVVMVRGGEELDFVRDLPVRKFPGIGPVAERHLVEAGVTTLGALLDLPPALRARFAGHAESVRRAVFPTAAAALGADRPAFREHDPDGGDEGSISNERTFMADLRDESAIVDQLRALAERVCWRARRRGVLARTVTLKLRFSDFSTISRARTGPPTNDEAAVLATVRELAAARGTGRVRLLGIALSNLERPGDQLALPLAGARQLPSAGARPQVGSAIDAVRARFGYDAIRLGATGRRSEWIA